MLFLENDCLKIWKTWGRVIRDGGKHENCETRRLVGNCDVNFSREASQKGLRLLGRSLVAEPMC